MPRIWQPPVPKNTCPPHEWVEVENERYYMLQCAKHPDHIWPDPRDRRD